MAWDRSLETGVPIIDTQHKELVRNVEALLDIGDRERFGKALSFLEGYIVRHFGDEEKLQIQSKYPKYERHKGYHDNFTATFKKLKGKFASEGHTASNNIELHKIAMGWLKEHIKVHDREFAEYYKATAL